MNDEALRLHFEQHSETIKELKELKRVETGILQGLVTHLKAVEIKLDQHIHEFRTAQCEKKDGETQRWFEIAKIGVMLIASLLLGMNIGGL